EHMRRVEREPPIAGGDGMAERLRGDQGIVRRCRERGDIASACPVERARRSGRTRLDIGKERRALGDARGRGACRKSEGAHGECASDVITYWDNSALLRLQGRPN